MGTGQPNRRSFIKIIFVSAVIILISGALYYFNLLPYKSPKQQGKQMNIPNTNYSPSSFQYDAKKAETLLAQYLKDVIKPEFLPAKIEVKQSLPAQGRTQDPKKEFGLVFTDGKASFSANFHYKDLTNIPNDFVVFIQLEKAGQASVTGAFAAQQTASYFKNPYKVSDCQTKGTASYCENFQILTDGKKGYGIVFAGDPKEPLQIIFTCFIPKESRGYETQKSCIGFQ